MPSTWIFAVIGLLAAAGAGAGWKRERRLRLEERARLQVEHAALLAQHGGAERSRATAAERERIFRDLHDDLGAQLLELVYTAPHEDYARRARNALQQMRASVADARRPPAPLHEVLAELHAEAQRRLAEAGVALEWEQDPALPNVTIDQGRVLHVLRIVREAITNSLKHGEPHKVRVRMFVVAGQMVLDVTDDGHFEQDRAGSGTAGMRERASEMGAEISWKAGTWGGTKVALRMPLEPDAGSSFESSGGATHE